MNNPIEILAETVRLRTYARRSSEGSRESVRDMEDRVMAGLESLGEYTGTEIGLLRALLSEKKVYPSGRFLWVGGTEHSEKPANYPSLYNCVSLLVDDPSVFGLLFDLAMQGCGTGAILEEENVRGLPPVVKRINKVTVRGSFGEIKPGNPETKGEWSDTVYKLQVGDSRKGWVEAYQKIINFSLGLEDPKQGMSELVIDISHVRPKGQSLKGFGGVSNPDALPRLFTEMVRVLNNQLGKPWEPINVCYLIDLAAYQAVAGNIRRSAGMRQFSAKDKVAGSSKDNLWKCGEDGVWRIDPEWDALRMANHTRVYHKKPTYEEVLEATKKQYYYGEGAIQWAGEAVYRANTDYCKDRSEFLKAYEQGKAEHYLKGLKVPVQEIEHRVKCYGINPCGEIIGNNFFCNLSEIHLNQLDPNNLEEQYKAFHAGGLLVASLLHHQFITPRFQKSREIDPIVGVSFTGLFDFFIKALGPDWLRWVIKGDRERDSEMGKQFYDYEVECLTRWRWIARDAVHMYCDRAGIRHPNRITTVQPAGTKSILTGASSGWHPDKAKRYIRRVTFRAYDPVALAARDLGYKVIPSQNSKHADGSLMDDPYDPDCGEWLVEYPIEKPWANYEGVEDLDLDQISIKAQWDLYMTVQQYYTDHNTSATLELREPEIPTLANLIYQAIQNDAGYSSAAVLARFDDHQTFPRLPFEPISKEQYDRELAGIESRRIQSDLSHCLAMYDRHQQLEGPAGCDSASCLL